MAYDINSTHYTLLRMRHRSIETLTLFERLKYTRKNKDNKLLLQSR